ncbi:hypothetical protein EPIB1_1885 [Tritonibacter mobilis]|nr:hypothetical protein EPIB1_1885 [Tritonibacter mobilis]
MFLRDFGMNPEETTRPAINREKSSLSERQPRIRKEFQPL